MNPKEAIEYVNQYLMWLPIIDGSPLKTATKMAIASLEKQVPKKPNKIWRSEGKTSHGDCPICGRLTFDTSNYCHACGQAIDWKEEI